MGFFQFLRRKIKKPENISEIVKEYCTNRKY